MWSISPDTGLAVSKLQSLTQRDLVLPANFFPVGQIFTATYDIPLMHR
jgi:hypothetical protein